MGRVGVRVGGEIGKAKSDQEKKISSLSMVRWQKAYWEKAR